MATSLFAQAPLREAPVRFGTPVEAPAPVAGSTSKDPAKADVDREAIQKIVRDELQADKAKSAMDAKAPDPDPIEVGKDRTLRPRWDNGFVAESADKAFRIHLGGRLEFDNSWFSQSDNLLLGSSASQRMLDGTLFRRARLRADGQLWGFIDFACEVNFANIQDVSNVDNSVVQVGSVGLTDCYLTFRDIPCLGNVRVGHLQAPIGLERYSSSNAWYYMERSSLYDAFLGPNDYQNGVVVFDSYLNDRVTLAGSATWISKSDIQSFGFDASDGKYAFGVRVTALPIYADEGRTLMHLGAGYGHQTLVNSQFSVASRELLRAGAGGTQTPNLVFTGTFFTPNGVDIANAEAALVLGPFSVSGEYAIAHVRDAFETENLTGPRGDVTYQAAYVETGLFVTPDDNRRYDKKTGTWARTIPADNVFAYDGGAGRCFFGHGAVQLVARYTYLNLVDGDPTLTPTSGGARAGRQRDLTLGVNWYLNSQTWFMVNYVATHIDSVVAGASGNIQGIGCRLHIDF
jgi:phosphate-selective porin OprO/OprP